jgi:hypothetical protein
MPLTRMTVVPASPLAGEDAARRWLDGLGPAELEDEVRAGLATVNRALHAHALGSHDPSLGQVGRSAPLVARVGYGTGEQLADGRWTRALEVPPSTRRQRRTEALRPAERLASVLGGRERPEVCETLLLRARADVDAGRRREGALQLRVGLEALLAEVEATGDGDEAEDLQALEDRRESIVAIADAALRGEPSHAQAEEAEATLAIAERVLRRRRILGGR